MATRYQIVYGKSGFPLVVWKDDFSEAVGVAKAFRASGYEVSIWEHDEKGAREIAF